MTDRELMQQALDALIWTTGSDDFAETGKAREGAVKVLFHAIESLSARLAQPEPEPVAWHEPGAYGNVTVHQKWAEENSWQPLYTAPQREWQGLTAYEIQELNLNNLHFGNFACAIEAKLKEKNNG